MWSASVRRPGSWAKNTLARRRVLGEDHPGTLRSAAHLAADLAELGEHQAAKELNEGILDRRRRVLGDGHPDTIASAAFVLILSGLAADPRAREAMETMKPGVAARRGATVRQLT